MKLMSVNKKKGARALSALLVLAMIVGLFVALNPSGQAQAADKTTNIDGFSAELIADPNTSSDSDIFNGSSAEDGKIWTDKSVTTGTMYGATAGEDNFNVALSAMGQTYSIVEAGMSTEQQNIAYDVVFVLDFSGSMADNVSGSNTSKAQALVNAVNPAIATLMENENNRIGIVGYSGSDGTVDNTTELFALDHYTTTDAAGEYLEYTTSRGNSSIRAKRSGNTYYVRNSSNRTISASKNVTGGTPTQAGIYSGMEMLRGASKSEEITRIPILVLLTDGAAGVAKSGYTNLSGSTYEGDAHNGRDDEEVGAYTVLTANYAKDQLDASYKAAYDYSGIISNYDAASTEVAKFYTIGLGIGESTWTHFILDPSTTEADRDSTVQGIKQILNRDTTYGSDYAYADEYFGGSMTEDDLKKAFEDIIASMEIEPKVTTSVYNPVSDSSGDVVEGSYITFIDYLGYKMELKGEKQYLRYGGVNYEFTKQSDGSYQFSGKNQAGAEVTGPIITEGDTTYSLSDVIFKAEFDDTLTVNGQTGYYKVTWSFPSAMLPMYSREDGYGGNLQPIRMLYEVGLEESVDLMADGLKIDADGSLLDAAASEFHDYAFYTNLYDFAQKKAMTTVDFTPSKDNPYYYKTGYTTDVSDNVATDKTYLKVDMKSGKTQSGTVEGTADVTLTNISISQDASVLTFTYNGTDYEIDLTGSNNNGYSGQINLTVTGETADGETVEDEVTVAVEVSASWWFGWNYTLDRVTVQGVSATLTNNRATATANNVPVSMAVEPDPSEASEEEIVSVYMELKEDADGKYIEDLNGNRIDVAEQSDGTYEIKIGQTTYISNVYYKYADYTSAYTNKDLDKGNVIKSFVGQLEITQPTAEGEALSEENFGDFFQYHSADGTTVTKATGILFPDGTSWGTVTQTGEANRPPEGTFKVCIDGITNQNNPGVVVNFDFIIETQTIDGDTKYDAIDAAYFEAGDGKNSVEINLSGTPTVTQEGDYLYDVSYTIVTANPDEGGNKTQTDNGFFLGTLDGAELDVLLGNNGRVAVEMADNTYDKDVTVQKEWRDRAGNALSLDHADLAGVSVEAGLYQEYSYTDSDGVTVETGDSPVLYKQATLNSENGFQHTWSGEELPRYLVDSGGNYVLDQDGEKVEITYVVGEVSGADGWSLESTTVETNAGVDTFTLVNVPQIETSPSVTKVWTSDGEAAEAPDGYQVKVELLANGEPVVNRSIQDTSNKIFAVLTQEDGTQDATLEVKFGADNDTAESLERQTVAIADFANPGTSKTYTFEYNDPTGTPGAGDYAESATISITVSNTFGAKLGISDARTTYHYKDTDNADQSVTLIPRSVVRNETDTAKTAEFTMNYVSEEPAVVILDGIENDSWSYTWENWDLPMLEKDDATGEYTAIVYSVRETLIVNGTEYTPDANGLITVPQTDGTSIVYKATSENTQDYQFTITNDEGLTDISATKVWKDNENKYNTRPDSITFTLVADGVEVEDSAITINPTDNSDVWNGTEAAEWTDVPLYNATGEKIEYTVEETIGTQPEGADQYTTTVTEDESNPGSFIVTNSLYPVNVTSMDVEKVWIDDDNAAGKRPGTLYMVLYRTLDGSGEEPAMALPGAASVVAVNDANNWSSGWQNLTAYSEDGVKYIYSVKEYDSPSQNATEGVTGYTDVSTEADKTETKYTFRNQLEEGSVNKTVNKVWLDEALEDERPENVTVILSGKTTDGNDVDLTAYGVTAEQTLSADGSWSYTWEALPEYVGGMKVDYTITETKVGDTEVTEGTAGNYTAEVTDDGEGNVFTVTNTLTGETTVSVTKEWKDTPEGFVIPDAVFTIIGENNTVAGELTVNAANNYTATSGALPKYNANGAAIQYTLREQDIEIPDDADYTIDAVIGENTTEDGTFVYEASNTYRSFVQDLTGTKTWAGVTGANIPDAITVALYRQTGDGEAELVTEDGSKDALQPAWTKNNDGTWTYTYTDMPVYADVSDASTVYTYTIKETSITAGETTVNVVYTDAANGTAGGYKVTLDGLDITNTSEAATTSVEVTKNWSGVTDGNIPSIQIQLVQDGTPMADRIVELTADNVTKDGNTWKYTFNDLPVYTEGGILQHVYTVKELSVGGTEVVNGKAGDYEVTTDGLVLTNTLTGTVDEINGTKIWKDAAKVSERPAVVTVGLYRTTTANPTPEQVASQSVSGTTDNAEWAFTFNNDGAGYPKYDTSGNLYTYFVRELDASGAAVEDGGLITYGNNQYKTTYGIDGYTITNTLYGEYKPDVNPIIVTKNWLDDDNSQNKRPDSVTVTLTRNNEEQETITLTKEDATQGDTSQSTAQTEDENEEISPVAAGENSNGWTKAFAGTYPMYDSEGRLYNYSVKENELTDYTLKELTGDAASGFVLTNVYAPGEMSITVSKVWVDNGNALAARPGSLDLTLVRSDGVTQTVTVTAEEQWTKTLNVSSTDANGVMYSYTVQEPDAAIAGTDYVKSESGLTVTNTLKGTEHVQGTKSWENIDEAYRPESVTVELWRQLAAEGEASPVTDGSGNIMTIETNAESGWAYDFGELDKYDANGAMYTYIVKETLVNGISLEDTDYVSNTDGYNITNSISEETKTAVTVSGTKTWVDNDDQYKMRPASITVSLLCDGEELKTQEVKAAEDGTWTYAFTDLPKYDMNTGKLLEYTIEEKAVENYITAVDGTSITNKLDETKIPKPEDPKKEEPKKTTETGVRTGDQSRTGLYGILTAVSVIVIAAALTVLIRRRKRYN